MRARIRGVELFFDVDGPAVAVDDGMVSERPVLALLHGGPGMDHTLFKGPVAQLRDTAQLLYIDHRGCGRSGPCPPQTQTLEHNIKDLEALRDYLGIERLFVLGHSYGGMVALGYTLRYPQRVAGLMLSATAPSYRFLEEAQRYVRARCSPEQQEACGWLFRGDFPGEAELKQYFRLMMPLYSRKFDPEKLERTWGQTRRSLNALNLAFATFLREFDYVEQLPQIRCPTLVLAGRHDWVCPLNQSELIAQRIPGARLVIHEQAAHSLHADEPETYVGSMRAFLRAVIGSEARS